MFVAVVDGAQDPLEDRTKQDRQQSSAEDQDRNEGCMRPAEREHELRRRDAESTLPARRMRRKRIDNLLHAEYELQAGGDEEQQRGVKHAGEAILMIWTMSPCAYEA